MGSRERQLINAEITQRKEEGCDVSAISVRVTAALDSNASDLEMTKLYDELISLPIDDSFNYTEPSTLEEIRSQRPEASRKLDLPYNEDALFDRMYGAWLGRVAGCALGKPVEGWNKAQIDKLLKELDALPLNDFIPFKEGVVADIWRTSTRGNIHFMDRDDDLDYTILGLLALERYGAALSPRGMTAIWLENFPFEMACTAENSAYRNFVMGKLPPVSFQRGHSRNRD